MPLRIAPSSVGISLPSSGGNDQHPSSSQSPLPTTSRSDRTISTDREPRRTRLAPDRSPTRRADRSVPGVPSRRSRRTRLAITTSPVPRPGDSDSSSQETACPRPGLTDSVRADPRHASAELPQAIAAKIRTAVPRTYLRDDPGGPFDYMAVGCRLGPVIPPS